MSPNPSSATSEATAPGGAPTASGKNRRSSRRGPLAGVSIIVVVVVVAVGIGVVVSRHRVRDAMLFRPDGSRRPNILVVMTDDQTLESLRVMQNVGREMAVEGTTFTHYYISFPNCCPSRATYYTGQYSHNNGVEDNEPPLGGAAKFKDSETLPVWLQRSGYYTAHVGKYLNGWGNPNPPAKYTGGITPPPGWDHWFGLIDPTTYQYFDYKVSVDGAERQYGEAEADYQTDVLGGEVVKVIRQQAGADQPWFVSWTPLAPHAEKPEASQIVQTEQGAEFKWAMPTPAPRHDKSLVANLPPSPAYNEDNAGKPKALQDKEPVTDGIGKLIEQSYRLELKSLLSVDEWVGRIFQTLRDTNQLDDTVVVFTSDNGIFHGEHRLAFVKYYLYEPAVNVPLLIRGGPFGKGVKASQPAVNADLAPTILALAGASPTTEPDGIDLARLAADPKVSANRGVLLENKSRRGQVHSEAIHTERYVYIEHETGEKELYDIERDPDQLHNLGDDPGAASLRDELARRLSRLRRCKGSACVDNGT